MQEPASKAISASNEINSKLLEQSNTNVGDIADNYFILFKKPSTEDDDDDDGGEDVVIDDDDVVAGDSDDIVLDESAGDGGGGGGRSSDSTSSGEPQFQSTSTTTTTTEPTQSSTIASTTLLEGHFDSVNRENAFAETTENNILKTRQARDDDDDDDDGGDVEEEFSSRKGYYHFTGNRLPSSALSSLTSTSTSSNYTKAGVTNQDDMGESLYLSIPFWLYTSSFLVHPFRYIQLFFIGIRFQHKKSSLFRKR